MRPPESVVCPACFDAATYRGTEDSIPVYVCPIGHPE
jgi:hypothetical protein